MKLCRFLLWIVLPVVFLGASCPGKKIIEMRTGRDGAPMVRVPGGEFTMGDNSGDADEQPERRVTLSAFWLDRYEVTNALYGECVKAGKCRANKQYEGFTGLNQPVVGVSWKDAADYCKWAGKRLPTEAEWEKAARGEDGRQYPWGDALDCARSNYRECGRKASAPAGSYPGGKSPYGAYEMAGNAREWVKDWYDPDYYRAGPAENPPGPETGKFKVVRGGMWRRFAYQMRSADRAAQTPKTADNATGFRCAAD